MTHAASFAQIATDAVALQRSLLDVARKVSRPTAGFVFLTGVIGRERAALARVVKEVWPGVPTLIAHGSGVLTEQIEHEGQSAAAGLLVSGPQATPLSVREGESDIGASLESQLLAVNARNGTVVMFVSPALGVPVYLGGMARIFPGVQVIGGGTANNESPLVIGADGRVSEGPLGGLLLRGAGPLVGVSPACRLLGGMHTISETRGNMVLRIGDEPALDVLTRAAQALEGKPMVLGLLPDPRATSEQIQLNPLHRARLRPVRGVDPSRKAIVLSEPLREGDRLGFAVLDGPAARVHMEATLRELSRQTAGAAARFGLYVNCAGRGSGLYGTSGVDSKLLRARFGSLPVAGMMSSFEIAPVPDQGSLHFYTGVFGLFTTPS